MKQTMTTLAVAIALTASSAATAGTLRLSAGAGVQDSTWDGDVSGSGSLELGYRWGDLSVIGLARLGYAEVDQRVLQYLAAGGEYQLRWRSLRPFLRVVVSHLHESPRVAIDHDKATLFGFGSGIRHRGGIGGAVGTRLMLRPHRSGQIFAAAEINADYLVGASGPSAYWGGGVALGFTFGGGKVRR